jgi:hypothetical protein
VCAPAREENPEKHQKHKESEMKRKHFAIESGNSTSRPDASKAQRIERLSEEWWATRTPEVRARRCTARRRNGESCQKVSIFGGSVCGTHGGRAPQVKRRARQRLDEAADLLARELLLLAKGAESETVQLGAIRDALDRVGLTGKSTVEVEHTLRPWEAVLASVRGVRSGSRAEHRERRGLPALPPADEDDDVLDAEVVEDGADSPARGRTRSKRARRRERDVSSSYDADEPITGMRAIEEAARANREAGVYPTRRRRR